MKIKIEKANLPPESPWMLQPPAKDIFVMVEYPKLTEKKKKNILLGN